MRVLLDENVPHKLRGLLTGHEVVTVAYLKWIGIKNGDLLRCAAEAGFDVLVTSDQGIPYEQNMTGRKLAMVMLSTPDWNLIKTASVNQRRDGDPERRHVCAYRSQAGFNRS